MHTPILPVKKLTQVALIVSDIEKTAQAYATLFGMPMPPIRETPTEEISKIRYQDQPTPARAKIAFFRFENIDLELIEPIGEPSSWREHLDAHGDSVHHLAVTVDSCEETAEELAQQGFPSVQTAFFRGGRCALVDTNPALGVTLELLEFDKATT